MVQKENQKNMGFHFTFVHLPGSSSRQTLLPVLLLLVVIRCSPIAAICRLSWQMATVPTLDSGLIALAVKSQSIQAIYGLSARARIVRHVWSRWDRVHRWELLHTYCFPRWKYGQHWGHRFWRMYLWLFHRLCVGALMLSSALLEEATLMITSTLHHLYPGGFK